VIAAQLEKSYDIRRKIKGAMMYPAIVFSVIIGIGVLMMIYVVPTLSSTFKSFDAELPATTRFVIGTSDFLSQHTFSAILGFLFIASVIVEFFRSRMGKRALSFFVLHAPVVQQITKQANAALTMRTLASLIKSGLGIVKGLEITKEVVQNPYYVTFLEGAEKEVQKGVTLASIFEKDTLLYPPLVGEMIQVGEETGKLGELLNKGAQFYEDEVDAITKNLSTIIEPLIMVFVGIAVGFFALSMIQPLYSLGNYI
jgi:type IV pilus assembly protein PilC